MGDGTGSQRGGVCLPPSRAKAAQQKLLQGCERAIVVVTGWLSPHIFFSELVRSWCPQQEVGTWLCYSHDSVPRREAPLTSPYHLLQGSVTSCSHFALLLAYFLAAEL